MSNLVDVNGNGLGYEFEAEKHEELVAGSAPWSSVMEISNAPPEIDYGQGLSIRNQGNRPSCRGHSITACARMGARLAAGGDIDLDQDGKPGEAIQDDFSPLWAWVRTQMHGGTVGENRGATIGGGVKLGTEDGFATETEWPYSNPHTTRIPDAVAQASKRFKFARYQTMDEESQVHAWFASGQGPVEWGKTWPFPWVAKCLVDAAPSGGGGHATAIRGYWTGERVASAVPALASRVKAEPYVYVCENSHSVNAQYQGLYFVTRRGMASVLKARWTELIGWSDLSFPFVRKFDWATAKLA